MHIDKYVVNNIGTKWTNGKSKKNQLLASLDGTGKIGEYIRTGLNYGYIS